MIPRELISGYVCLFLVRQWILVQGRTTYGGQLQEITHENDVDTAKHNTGYTFGNTQAFI
ncbi:hypothetical protein PR003_g23083 [Phytophthora rubi]|uniref:Pectate lyase n=1 Tax=Phytophthora rubi TaxID=129364 RepID=A0A6A3LI59_9STRA|nr:hypothetical protein PR002_g21684 [Phytophthora rubi]KAE9015513.1 hypothetical protein PR001_g14884 [Phytophthora rubi]KAE9299111.1 hypothetical protein PR003_g23083 [Phytophthora rubi]